MNRVLLSTGGRLLLGTVFVAMGVIKAVHPAAFLLDLLQYPLAESHFPVVWIAALLPWMEIVFGGALLLNRATPGAALILLALIGGLHRARPLAGPCRTCGLRRILRFTCLRLWVRDRTSPADREAGGKPGSGDPRVLVGSSRSPRDPPRNALTFPQ